MACEGACLRIFPMEGVGPFQARGQSGGLRGGKGGWARAVGPPWGRQGPGAWAGEESGLMLGLRGLAWWAEAEPGVQAGRREDGRHPGSLRVFGPCRELTLVASRGRAPRSASLCWGRLSRGGGSSTLPLPPLRSRQARMGKERARVDRPVSTAWWGPPGGGSGAKGRTGFRPQSQR